MGHTQRVRRPGRLPPDADGTGGVGLPVPMVQGREIERFDPWHRRQPWIGTEYRHDRAAVAQGSRSRPGDRQVDPQGIGERVGAQALCPPRRSLAGEVLPGPRIFSPPPSSTIRVPNEASLTSVQSAPRTCPHEHRRGSQNKLEWSVRPAVPY